LTRSTQRVSWAKIKKPYKDLMAFLLNSPFHVIICGRQGVEYEENEETGKLKNVGFKMKAEGETPYEPHVLIRLAAEKPEKTNDVGKIIAYVEKDRTGVLSGRNIINPDFASIAAPMLGLLGGEQAQMASEDETAAVDAEALQRAEREREAESTAILRRMAAQIELAQTPAELNTIGKEITPTLKAKMLPAQLAELRSKFTTRLDELEKVIRKEP
jgi:hypothetical protein